jgi:hypothetical protein
LPQRDSDDFQLGPTDSSRAVDVVPMYWMQRGRAERLCCCSSNSSLWGSGDVALAPVRER